MKLKWCKRTRSGYPTGEIHVHPLPGARRFEMGAVCLRPSGPLGSSAVLTRPAGFDTGAAGCTSPLVGRRDSLGLSDQRARGGARLARVRFLKKEATEAKRTRGGPGRRPTVAKTVGRDRTEVTS